MESNNKLLILEIGVRNKNGRIYTQDNVDKIIKDFNSFKESGKPVYGELDNPTSMVINLSKISHAVVDLIQEKNLLYGDIKILDTPKGKEAELLFPRLELGLRGMGMVNEDGTISDIELITFDLVLK
jgi:hypothetical protein